MIWFAGDPHSQFDHILRLAKAQRPSAIVLLGDIECSLPLERILSPILDFVEIWFIPGNHDCDTQQYWDNLAHSQLADRNLHGKVATIDGFRVAGLGGVFERPIWRPDEPFEGFQSYAAYEAFMKGRRLDPELLTSKLLRQRASIYPDDYFSLAMETADILVTHEAPHFHRHGFKEITELAQHLSVQTAFHGHHHETHSYPGVLQSHGFSAMSVGLRSIVDLHGTVVWDGSQRRR